MPSAVGNELAAVLQAQSLLPHFERVEAARALVFARLFGD